MSVEILLNLSIPLFIYICEWEWEVETFMHRAVRKDSLNATQHVMILYSYFTYSVS